MPQQSKSSSSSRAVGRAKKSRPLVIPTGESGATLRVNGHDVTLTNLKKPFWPEIGATKGDLLQYYADVSQVLLPHVKDRAMVMKRYPHGAHGEFFFMKRAPEHRPEWIQTCSIEHSSGSIIEFPVVQDLASLLWIINLGCIDLNPWYARCGDVDRPDYVHFDLDPVETKGKPSVPFAKVRETALIVRDSLEALGMKPLAKTTGSRGIHIYVAIEHGPLQKEVWTFAKALAVAMAQQYPELVTAEYRLAKRPAGRVLVDYNQNAWGRTLAGVYSVRPKKNAPVSAPVTWEEIEAGVEIEDFTIQNMPARVAEMGDLWAPLNRKRGRFDLRKLLN